MDTSRLLQRQSTFLLIMLGVVMIVSAISRLGNPPISPRQENWFVKGEFHLNQGKYRNAYERFRKVLALNPDHVQARSYLKTISALGYPNDPSPTVLSLQHIEKLRIEGEASALLDMIDAELNLSMGRAEKAIELHQSALTKQPGLANNWLGLGQAQLAAGYNYKAESAFAQAVALNPSPKNQLALGNYFLFVKQWKLARAAFDSALDQSPWMFLALHGQIRALGFLGEFDLAINGVSRLLESVKENSRYAKKILANSGPIKDNASYSTVSGIEYQDFIAYCHWLERFLTDIKNNAIKDKNHYRQAAPGGIQALIEFDLRLIDTL